MDATGAQDVVGRVSEMATIEAILAARRRHGIALVGLAGVGKSRLAAEARELAEAQGMAVVTAIATPVSANITLGALSHLLPPAGELSTVHSDLQPTQLLQAARATLSALAEGRPLVLMIDDAHHLDAVSAHLVHQLTATDDVFTVLTIRSGEPLAAPISAMWKDSLIERIDIGPLSADATAALGGQVVNGLLDPEACRWLWRTSGGNALYARELVIGALENGSLELRRTQWRLKESAARMSPRLTELVEHRLVELTVLERRALDLVAFAEPLGLELAQQIVGDEVLFDLDERGLLTVTTAGYRAELRPAHPLFGEALRQQPMTLRRRSDLLSLIDRVVALGARRRDDPVRIAGWTLAAGGRADPLVLVRAAIAAQSGLDDHTAVRLAQQGVDQQVDDEHLRNELHVTLATSLARLGRYSDADEALASLSSLTLDDTQLARLTMRRMAILSEGADDVAAAEAAGRDGLARLAGSPWEVDVRSVLATMLADFGNITSAADVMTAIAERPTEPRSAAAFDLAVAVVLQGQGRWSDCATSAKIGYEFHIAHPFVDTTFVPMSQFVYRLTAFTRGGRLEEAEIGCKWVLDSFANEPRPIGNVVLRLMLGRVVFAAGRFNDARELFADALARWTPTMQPYTQRWARSMLQWCNVCTGRPVDDDLDDISAGSRGGVGFGGTDIQGGVLAARIAQGQRAAAQRTLRRDIAVAEECGDIGSLLDLLTFACVEFTDTTSAVALAAHAQRLAAGPNVAAGPMPSYGAQVALAAATRSNTAADWNDAAELYRKMEHHFIAARLQARAATAAGAEGDRRLATSFTNLARRDAERCHDAVIPELSGVVTDGPGVVALTPREMDIVRMVAAGKSSKDVAAALFLSVRTVDNHLQRVYAKLGVSSRQDLAAALDSR